MNQHFSDADILKSILKKRRMTQEDLARLLGMGRTKLNMTLAVDMLPDEFRQRVTEALQLPADTFPPRAQGLSKMDLETLVPDLMKKVEMMLAQQAQILQLLQTRA
jgi:transcriptional regulator with XRE-family HTH domain